VKPAALLWKGRERPSNTQNTDSHNPIRTRRRRNEKMSEHGISTKKTNAAQGPATPAPHCSWSFEIRLPATRSSGDDVTGPTAFPKESHFYRHRPQRAIRRIAPATAAAPDSPTRSKSVKWRRPQCPDSRKSSRASECPLATHPRECQLLPASPQSSFDRLESSHVAGPTLQQNVANGNKKGGTLCAKTVDA